MRVQRLNVDFQRRPSTTWTGVLVLLIGLAAVGSVAAMHQRLGDEVTVLELRVRKAAPASLARVTAPSLSPAELSRMQTVAKQLNIPWERFFAGIEKVASEEVVLLNVHPDANKGTVRIAGEARDFNAALRWIEALNAGKVFRDAQLVEHEVNQQSPEAPVRFALSARWRPE